MDSFQPLSMMVKLAMPNTPGSISSLRDLTRRMMYRIAHPIADVNEHGAVDFTTVPNWFHAGQRAATYAMGIPTVRTITLLAGKQSGKTSFGPWWLGNRIQLLGPGDYVVAAPRHTLLKRKPLPEMQRQFIRDSALCTENKSDGIFYLTEAGYLSMWGTTDRRELHKRFARTVTDEDGNIVHTEEYDQFPDQTRILFLHTEDPLNLESGTYKAIWFDECGMPTVTNESWRALANRLVAMDGYLLNTTTPYRFGLFKTDYCDACMPEQRGWSPGDAPRFFEGLSQDGLKALVRFESRLNPLFPATTLALLQRQLPEWLFDLYYRAIFTRPVGQVMTMLDKSRHLVKRQPIEPDSIVLVGVDFGSVNFAAVFARLDKARRKWVIYASYCPGQSRVKNDVGRDVRRETSSHVEVLRKLSGGMAVLTAGGNKSENAWRADFAVHGWPISVGQCTDPDVRLMKIANMLRHDLIEITEDAAALFTELFDIGYELNDQDEPTGKVANRSTYHRIDALGYIIPIMEQYLMSLGIDQSTFVIGANEQMLAVSQADPS